MTLRSGYVLGCLLLALTTILAQQSQEPIDLGTEERTTVRLVLIDTVVIDEQGRTVADLTIDDFVVRALGRPVEIDTLDVDCSAGALPEPSVVGRNKQRESLPPTDGTRRIAMVFDYLHFSRGEREEALRQARELLEGGGTGSDEVMLAALTGGLRVEQPFTEDRGALLDSLRRMQYDVTLWNGYFTHVNEFGFIDGLTGLFDVLGTVPGPKAVVLFSGMLDVPLELQFQQLAAVATVSRCSVYPVDVRGLTTPDIMITDDRPG
jgi:VWFA-related protein